MIDKNTGTTKYHRHWTRTIIITDGVKYFIDETESNWLLDIIATEIIPKNENEEFILFVIKVQDMQTDLIASDGRGHVLWSRSIDYTDIFPEGEIKFYVMNGVVMLPSEY